MHQKKHGNCRQKISEEQKHSPFLRCAELILPWLTPSELANSSVTCKFLFEISESITRFRSLDASRSLENISIPFHNAVDNVPYAYFFYTPSQITSSSCSWSLQRQFWGPSFGVDSMSAQREEFENGCGSVSDSTESKIKLGLDLVTSRLQKPTNRLEMESVAFIDGLGAMSTERKQLDNETVGFRVDSVSLVDESEESESGCECEKCLQVGNGNEIFGCPCYSGTEETGIVSECGPECKCGPECENRFTQRGITVRLKIVRDHKKGWCLFADQPIPRGKFICEYAGKSENPFNDFEFSMV